MEINKMEEKILIMVVDDHPIVREGLVSMINTQPNMKVVAEAGNGREAVQKFHQYSPNVTLMDLRMPEMDGVKAILEIRKTAPNSRFIALTTYDGDEDIYRAVQADVQGYLLKGMHVQTLFEAIVSVHAGFRRIPIEIEKKLQERNKRDQLTPRELEILKLIVTGKSNREIADDLGLTERTVKNYLTNLYIKMRVSDRTQAATSAIQRGLVQLTKQ
jgi:DNA-binding NarL/FixJ family response regulator